MFQKGNNGGRDQTATKSGFLKISPYNLEPKKFFKKKERKIWEYIQRGNILYERKLKF